MNGRLPAIFPGLAAGGFRETSPATSTYNCIAWAAARSDQWWEPDPHLQFFWPDGIGRQYTLPAYIAAYESVGFRICPSGELEIFFEKIVVFVDGNGVPKHAARQLDTGKWTSKLGRDVDIEHANPLALSGQLYGQPSCFLRRPRRLDRLLLMLCRRVRTILTWR